MIALNFRAALVYAMTPADEPEGRDDGRPSDDELLRQLAQITGERVP